jgi:NADH dehydrogenase [ubiquinone] 1 alpha subcomplex assembly factor 5
MVKTTTVNPGNILFDRDVVAHHRRRAAQVNWAKHRFLFDEISDRLADRLLDVTHHFERALDLGCRAGALGQMLQQQGRVSDVYFTDLSQDLLTQAIGGQHIIADEEFLPFAPASFDLIGSVLSLHWTNDLPGSLIQIARTLRPDGLFLGAVFGIESLTELKWCLTQAELEVKGGVSPRVSPFTDVRDAGSLLQRAGFALPVTDVDMVTLKYANPFALMQELRGMGEANALVDRQKSFTSRSVLLRAAELYVEKYADADGLIPATFQIIYMTGWAPHSSQQKPLAPGSGTTNLKDVL